MTSQAPVTIVKEGWIRKRGEYIKSYRSRYFVLKSNGEFVGYKDKFDPTLVEQEVIVNFNIAKESIFKREKPVPNSLIMRCLLFTVNVERTFKFDSADERESWVQALQGVADSVMKEKKQKTFESPTNSDVSMDNFEVLKSLGTGTIGNVDLVRERSTGEICAIKILNKAAVFPDDDNTVLDNQVLQKNVHPFIAALKSTFETTDRLFFVMEYFNGGELFFHLSRDKRFSESRTQFYGAEIVSALAYIHEEGVIYWDLKLENILLDKEGHIKITNMAIGRTEISFDGKTLNFYGTPEYLAPEVIEDNDYGRELDWWTTGVVMYEMMCGRLPFYNREHERLFELILQENVSLPGNLSDEAKSLLSGLLEKDPKLRLGSGPEDGKGIKEHPFFASINWDDLVNKKIPPPFIPEEAN